MLQNYRVRLVLKPKKKKKKLSFYAKGFKENMGFVPNLKPKHLKFKLATVDN